jgi:Uma2 family endonuclease
MTANGSPRLKVEGDRLPPNTIAKQIMVMAAQSAARRRWTEDEFHRARDAAPQGERWELVDGDVLVTPSPHWTHQRIVVRLTILLDAFVRAYALGEVLTSPLDVKLEPSLVLQPDVVVVPTGELQRESDIVRHLLLAVEVVSASSARHDRVTKRPRYQRNRVPEYWIVDDRSQTIERWTPDDERPELIADKLVWHPDGARDPFVLDLVKFYADVAALPSDDVSE